MPVDPIYEVARNTLIPTAAREATKRCGRSPKLGTAAFRAWCARWNRAYHAAMNRLAGKSLRKAVAA